MKNLYWIVPVLALASCQPEVEKKEEAETSVPEEKTTIEPVEEETPEAAFDVNASDSLVGQPFKKVEPALKAAGILYRVVEKDGQSFAVTMDYLGERLNFRISNGMITAVTKG